MPFGGLLTAGVLSVGAPIVSGAIGNALSGDDKDAEMAARQAALQQILGIDAPTAEQLAVQLSKQEVVGQLSPEMVGTVTQGDSALKDIQVDPRLRDAQLTALASLEKLGVTGLSPTDRVALMEISKQTSGDANAAQQSALQNAAARGTMSGGQALAAQIIGSQAAANRGAEQGMKVASIASERALDAIAKSGLLGSQMENQQFGQESTKASAQDAISRFNAANRQQVMGSNVGAKNASQQFNLSNAQNVANSNTDIANKQTLYNSQAQQQAFQNKLQKANLATGGYKSIADQHADNAEDTRDMASQIGSGIAKAGGSIATHISGKSTPTKPNMSTKEADDMPSSDDWYNWAKGK